MRKLFPFLLILLLSACNLANLPNNAEPEQGEELLPTATFTLTPESQNELPTRTPPPTALPIPTTSNSVSLPPSGEPTNAETGSGSETTLTSGVAVPPQTITVDPIAEGERGYAVQTTDDAIVMGGVNILPVDIDDFVQNPARPQTYAVIDRSGLLYISDLNGANAFRVEQGPYTQFPAPSREANNAAATVSAWSPDGQYLAFIVDGNQQAADGMWYMAPGQFGPLQLLVDCPFEGFIGCNIVQPSDTIRFWESREVYWSPNSQFILTNVNLPSEGRRGLIVSEVTRNDRIRDQRPPIILYDYGTWGSDGRILASGRNPQGQVVVDWLNRDGSFSEVVYAAGVNGLWMGWAVEQPNGEILALGRQGDANGALAIYTMNGEALTPLIGDGFPQRVMWNTARTAVIVEVNNRVYLATTDGRVQDITTQSGNLAVNWVE